VALQMHTTVIYEIWKVDHEFEWMTCRKYEWNIKYTSKESFFMFFVVDLSWKKWIIRFRFLSYQKIFQL